MERARGHGKIYLLITAVIIFVFIFLKLIKKDRESQSEIKSISIENSATDQGRPSEASVAMGSDSNIPNQIPKESLQTQANIGAGAHYQNLSDAKKNSFLENAHMQIPLPENMNYDNLDLVDDNVIGLYGKGPDHSELTLLASSMNVSSEEVSKYIQASAEEIPNLKGRQLNWEENPQTFSLGHETGISDAQVQRGHDQMGHEIAVIFLKRLDQRGAYLLIYSAKPGGIENNDDYFDKLKDQIRARPANESR